MRIGVISEGHSDRAVIVNVIVGITGLDSSDIVPLRPIYKKDATDKANSPETFSNWALVKEECESRELIDGFLAMEGQDFVVIHLDTAEAELFQVQRPAKNATYVNDLRKAVVQKINEWLETDLSNSILYAIAVEEIDAWVLTVFEKKDSAQTIKAKERLKYILRRGEIDSSTTYNNYLILSKPFTKEKNITRDGFLKNNASLKAFYEEVQLKVLPKMNNVAPTLF